MIPWLVGGRQGRAARAVDRDHAALYVEGVLAQLDGTVVLRGPDRCFKGLAVDAGGLWVSAETQVHRVEGGRIVQTVTDPTFNDVHHAARFRDRLLVASTGADGVWVDGGFIPVVDGVAAPERDVRGLNLRPHDAHPNHLFDVDGEAWVTRGMLGDAVAVEGSGRWPLSDVVVHDGLVWDDGTWFTTVDGRLLCVRDGRVDLTVALAELDDRRPPLGWCRGLARDGDVVWVGFTRLRTTRWRHHLAWMRGALRRDQVASRHPTRVVAYDLATRRKVDEVLTEPWGLDAVFGLAVPR